MKTDIVLIDSGVNIKHPVFKRMDIQGINLTRDNSINNIEDNIGHGTAIYYLLKTFTSCAEILPIKIFDRDFSTDFEQLTSALEYVYQNIECKIIHLSNGITYCENIQRFYDLCVRLRKKGIIIVSAFDNGGAISYPAAFDNVIGVDWSKNCKHFSDYEYFENSIINFRGIGTEVRVPWLYESYNLVGGSSFAAPYITSLVYSYMADGLTEMDSICQKLKYGATKTYIFQNHIEMEELFSIKNAVVFPFNKEIHSLLRYENLLNFNIYKLCNTRFFGNVGKTVTEATEGLLLNNHIIYDLDQIDWESTLFDCFILGHSEELGQVLGKNFIDEIIAKCIKHEKNLYCFDDLSSYMDTLDLFSKKGLRYFYPHVSRENIPRENCGKLRHIGKPVIGVFGTSPRQGKYTLQLALRQRFLKDGYRVGQLGTEPTSLLFGFEACYPVGYKSTVSISGLDAICVINYLMGKIEDSNPDLIIVGSQSQTIPLNTGNVGLYTIYNQDIMLACEPDICILCINYNDEIEYIKRTIHFIESYVDTHVLGMVLFPLERNLRWSVFGNTSKKIDADQLIEKQKFISKKTGLPVILLNNEYEINNLYQMCLDFFCVE